MTELCDLMGVNRSGYYKWRARKGIKNRYEKDRDLLTELLMEVHMKHRSYGYHRLAAVVKRETGWIFSDNLAHKCCKYAGIRSRCNHYRWRPPKEEKKTCPNLIKNNWNASRPLEIVVSDMTVLKLNGRKYEWTYLLDTFNNEIISSHLSSRHGDPKPYYSCLNDLIEKVKEQTKPVTLHTDQGSIYSSTAFFHAHRQYNIIRSMSRSATPTDNPIIEAINGWIKSEIYSEGWHRRYLNANEMINDFVEYFNNYRPAYALNYKSPVQYKIEQGFL